MNKLTYNILISILVLGGIIVLRSFQVELKAYAFFVLLLSITAIQGVRRKRINLPFFFPFFKFRKHGHELKRMHFE